MPTFAKIPQKEKAKGAIASGSFAVFGSLLSVGAAITKLQSFTKTIPAHCFITIDQKRFYYCKYGLLEDQAVYSKK